MAGSGFGSQVGGAASTNAHYLQMALVAAGNMLAVVLCLTLYAAWRVLAGYQAALLWAVLCSVALRDIRDWLVGEMLHLLDGSRSLPRVIITLALLPFTALSTTFQDLYGFYVTWQQATLEHVRTSRQWRAPNVQLTSSAAVAASQRAGQHGKNGTSPGAPDLFRPTGQSGAGQLRLRGRAAMDGKTHLAADAKALGTAEPAEASRGLLIAFFQGTVDLCCFWAASVGLGVHALRSSVGRPNHPRSPSRPHPSRQESDTARGERSGYVQDGVTWDGAGPQEGAAPASASKVMLTWLLRGCVGYQLLTWLQGSMENSQQTAALAGTALLLGTAPLVAATTAQWMRSAQPDRGAPRRDGHGNSDHTSERKTQKGGPASAAMASGPATGGATAGSVTAGGVTAGEAAGAAEGRAARGRRRRRKQLGGGSGRSKGGWTEAWPMALVVAVDGWVAGCLRARVRPLVSALLIVGSLTAALLLGTFLTVQIGQESREALASLQGAIPGYWTLSDAADSLRSNDTSRDNRSRDDREGPASGVVRAVLDAAPWVEARMITLLQSYNMSQVSPHMARHKHRNAIVV